MYRDHIKYCLMLYLDELRQNRKIEQFSIKDNQIIINPYPKMMAEKDGILVESDNIKIEMNILDTEEMSDVIQRIKINIDNKLEREGNRRIFSSKFPSDEQILSASDGEDKRRFVQGAKWVLEYIKNSL